MNSASASIFTIGHSTRPIGEFLDLLKAYRVGMLVDVRTIPRSRYNPQFDRGVLPGTLEAAGVGYRHLPGLGGLRHARPNSPNTGWRNASFRGFADYMLSPEFARSLEELVVLARKETVAIMCAEAVPWRCHRMLIADALLVRGIETQHILGVHHCQRHRLTPMARASGTRIIYGGEQTGARSRTSPGSEFISEGAE